MRALSHINSVGSCKGLSGMLLTLVSAEERADKKLIWYFSCKNNCQAKQSTAEI